MRKQFDRLLQFRRSPLGVKLYRYVMGSVITTVVSFAVLTLVYGVFRWWGAVASTVFANVVATVPAYWLNRTWTWGKVGRSDLWREVMPFWVLSVLGIVISMGTAAVAGDLARAHHLGHLTAIVVVDGANLVAYGILFIGKYLIFERLFRVAEAVRARAAHGAPSAPGASAATAALLGTGNGPAAVLTTVGMAPTAAGLSPALGVAATGTVGLADVSRARGSDEDEPPFLLAASGSAG